jgi:hypothetical protein
MFRLRLWRHDLEDILNGEWVGLAPISNLKIKSSESGDSFVLTFETPALPPPADAEVQDITDALFDLSTRRGGGR